MKYPSHFYPKNSSQISHTTAFSKTLTIILVLFWSWPVMAGPPNSTSDDDASKKRQRNNTDQSTVKSQNNNQAGTIKTNPNIRVGGAGSQDSGKAAIQPQKTRLGGSRSMTDIDTRLINPNFNKAKNIGGSIDKINKGNLSVGAGDKLDKGKLPVLTGDKTDKGTLPIVTSDKLKTGKFTGDATDKTDKGKLPIVTGDMNNKGKFTGGTFDKTDKGKMPIVTGDMINKGKFSRDVIDKSDKNPPKLDSTTGTITPFIPTKPLNTKTIEDVKKRLGTGDSGVKRGPVNLNLGKTLDAMPLKDAKNGTGQNPAIKQFTPKTPSAGDTKIVHDDMLKSRFPDRFKSGELDAVAKGDIAKKVNLSEQFKLMQQGDVARRLDLHKNATGIVNVNLPHPGDVHRLNNVTILNNVNDYYAIRPHYYHGPVGPAYIKNCFKFVYFGPTFFAGACWYPSWNPWVAWSWHYHCRPIWDPRPIWCRPVIYDPYYDWVYWRTPVWAPLPVAQCGTWVEVAKPVFDVVQNDLQLLAVRFVDPGHPQEKLGPRYRVWFRNNGERPLEQPFNVMLFAGNDDKLSAEMPRSGVRVKAIEMGDTQSVDIRLPIEAATMWRDADGKPAPFQVLHVLIDANREIADINPANNGAAIQRDAVLPVDPAAFEVDPSSPQAGGEMTLAGEGLGPQPGQILINIGGRELQAEVIGWYDLGVRFNVPQLDINEPTPAEVLIVRGDGAATNPVKITILPAPAGPLLNAPPPPAVDAE
jgi:hypothetical protein